MTDRIRIGKISGVSGVRGEIKLFHDSGERERIVGIKELFFAPAGARTRGAAEQSAPGEDGGLIRKKTLSLRYRGKTPLLLVEGVETREAAEKLVGAEVYADRDALAPLEEGSYYVDAIMGFAVADESGGRIGEVAGVLDNPAHDILRVRPAGGGEELLLPMIDEFVRAVDLDGARITVRLPDGLTDIFEKG